MHRTRSFETAFAGWIAALALTTATAPASTTLTTATAPASPTAQHHRTTIPPGGSNWVPRSQLVPGLVTRDMDTGGETPTSLVQALVGTDVVISNVQYVGAPIAGGTFSGGTGIVGFQQGVILSSGNVASVVGQQNLLPDTSTDNLGLGDADLDALVGGLTEDAASLEFDFECPSANVISFQYVFTSEEYDEWVNTQYNDVFAFFLNGVNIALIPNTGAPVAINNVNCGNPYDPTSGTNCVQYVTNDCDSMGIGFPCTNIPMELDGKTVVFSATGDLQAGSNHIKLVIADRGDRVYDSDVFIRGTSFTCAPPGPGFDPPTPCGQTLTAAVGSPCHFEVDALATNGFPDEAVTLTVTGDSAPLAGGLFVPPLPVGPSPEVRTEFDWTPTPADAGTWHLQFAATDQIGQVSYCIVTIHVPAPSYLNFCVPGVNGVMPCPCSNPGDVGHGCDNSTGTGGALLQALGAASLGSDTLHFTSSFERATAFTVLMQARGPTHLGLKFGQGVRCVSSTVKRLYAHSAVAGLVVFPQGADLPVSQRSALKGDAITAGETRYYLAYYRDPNVQGSCNPAVDTFNSSQGMSVLWVP